jgi:thioredoxin reductase
MTERRSVDALIVGAGPAGLSAAAQLRRLGVESVLICERASRAGGVPRYTNHIGFGWGDLRTLTTGPRYASKLVHRAIESGAEILTETTVFQWAGTRTVCTTSPQGLCEIEAKAILLATGCRETPRSARLVPGTRPSGIFTTSSLQHFEYDYGTRVGKRAIVVGAEHVSFSAVRTLRSLGCKTLAMVTSHQDCQTYFLLKFFLADLYRIPIITHGQITRIFGEHRLEAVEVSDLATGSAHPYDVDTVVFTGEFIPECEQAYAARVSVDRGTLGPAVDQRLRTDREGIFAAGNVLRGAETAGVAAREGVYAAEAMVDYLQKRNWPGKFIPIRCESPLACVSPNRIDPSRASPPNWLMTWRVRRFVRGGVLTILQGERILFEQGSSGLVPNRRLQLCPTSWLDRVAPEGPQVTARIV